MRKLPPMSEWEKNLFATNMKKKSRAELLELKDDTMFIMSAEMLSVQTPEDLQWQLNTIINALKEVDK